MIFDYNIAGLSPFIVSDRFNWSNQVTGSCLIDNSLPLR